MTESHPRSTRHMFAALFLGLLTTLALAVSVPAAFGDEAQQETTVQTGKMTMRVYQKETISLTGVSGKITWHSSKPKVAKVTKKGVVTAKKVGNATITATFTQGQLICKVTVKKSHFKPVALQKLPCYAKYRSYMSAAQFKKAYKKALKIVRPLGDYGKKRQLQGIASALRELFDTQMTYSDSSAHYNDPYGYLVLKKASCAGCARTTGLCLNILGIKFEHVNEGKWTHQWCRVKVGKTYWICDAYGLYCGPEPGKRKHPSL